MITLVVYNRFACQRGFCVACSDSNGQCETFKVVEWKTSIDSHTFTFNNLPNQESIGVDKYLIWKINLFRTLMPSN